MNAKQKQVMDPLVAVPAFLEEHIRPIVTSVRATDGDIEAAA